MRRKRDVLETVARTAPPRTRLAGWLLQMPKLRPGLALYFALGGVAWPGVPAAAVVAGAFAMALCLLDYNLYRGRREDAVNWKAAHRPLAGVEQRIPSAEVLIAITGGFAMLAPLVVGRFGPALLYLTLIVGYVLAYEARYARRPSALVKTGSAVAVTIGVVLGVASAVAPPPWSLVVAGSGLVAWRACAEMSWDVLDEPADRANGIVTPVTKWGARRVLTFNGVATIAVVGASAVIACAHANLVVGTFIGAAAAAIIGGYAQTVRALTPGPMPPESRRCSGTSPRSCSRGRPRPRSPSSAARCTGACSASSWPTPPTNGPVVGGSSSRRRGRQQLDIRGTLCRFRTKRVNKE